MTDDATLPPAKNPNVFGVRVCYSWECNGYIPIDTSELTAKSLPVSRRFTGENCTGHTFIARILAMRVRCVLVSSGIIWTWESNHGQRVLCSTPEESCLFIIKSAVPDDKLRMLEIAHWMPGCENVVNAFLVHSGLQPRPSMSYRDGNGRLRCRPFRKKNPDPSIEEMKASKKKKKKKGASSRSPYEMKPGDEELAMRILRELSESSDIED